MADPAAAAGHSGGSPTAASPSGSGSGSGSFSASSGGSGSVSGQGSDKKPMFNTIRKFMGTLGRKSEPHLEVYGQPSLVCVALTIFLLLLFPLQQGGTIWQWW